MVECDSSISHKGAELILVMCSVTVGVNHKEAPSNWGGA